jgi:hypothetical protein
VGRPYRLCHRSRKSARSGPRWLNGGESRRGGTESRAGGRRLHRWVLHCGRRAGRCRDRRLLAPRSRPRWRPSRLLPYSRNRSSRGLHPLAAGRDGAGPVLSRGRGKCAGSGGRAAGHADPGRRWRSRRKVVSGSGAGSDRDDSPAYGAAGADLHFRQLRWIDPEDRSAFRTCYVHDRSPATASGASRSTYGLTGGGAWRRSIE